MRLLFVSNLYPPADLGGYEQICAEVAQGLSERGHNVWVLTSRFRRDRIRKDETRVIRELHLEADIEHYRPLSFFTRRARQERDNLRALRQAIDSIRPDLLIIWGMWNLSFNVPRAAEEWLPDRVAYYIASYWPEDRDLHHMYWESPANRQVTELLKRLPRRAALSLLGREEYPPDLVLKRTQCVSQYVRDRLVSVGKLPEGAGVVAAGIDADAFAGTSNPSQRMGSDQLRLLYFGSLLPQKGVHTAIEALGELQAPASKCNLALTILGEGHSDYVRELRSLTQCLGLKDKVHFAGRVPRKEVPRVLHEHDVFLFTSRWAEPLGRTILEAMAAGLVVIGADVGGSREILHQYSYDLLFAPDDPAGLAQKIRLVAENDNLRSELAEKGLRLVQEQYTMERTIGRLEDWFSSIVGKMHAG